VIFIIDDDKYVLRGFQILLLSAGLESKVFDCVEEFIENWDRDKNDILLLDVHMPGLNGCDLLKYLQEINLHISVILITAFDEEESRKESDKYGVLAYLTKPVNDEVLLDLLKNATTKLTTSE
jgi:two-component system, LuxR family, response regulator FixJ